jgi:hypothetical protein
VERLIAQLPERHLEMQAKLVHHAIDAVVERSPVMTGAYRGSHTVMTGEGRFVYEGRGRVGDETRVPDFPHDRYEPANAFDADSDVRATHKAYQRLVIRNGRYYASILEFGSPTKEPRAIYALAEASTEAEAERLALEGFRFHI